jgi:peptidyl-Lys metalloendopeptidase
LEEKVKTKTQISAMRKTLFGLMILALILSVFGSWNSQPVRAQEAAAETLAGAIVSLSADQASFGTAEDVTLHVTITNPNNYPIRMLKWFTPIEGVEEPLFTVTRDGKPVDYLCMVVNRADPTELNYITLTAGESLASDVDLSAYYDLSISGNYAVIYNVTSAEMYAAHDNKGKLSGVAGSLVSDILDLFIEGRAAPAPEEIVTALAVVGTSAFNSCTVDRQANLISARNAASTYANSVLLQCQ